MAFGSRIYSASESGVSFSTAKSVMELQLPIDVAIELIRAWLHSCSNDAALEEVQEVCIYGNDAAASGSAMLELKVQGLGTVAAEVAAVRDGTIGATPRDLYCDAFHLTNGWEYYPLPEERIWLRGNTVTEDDNIGIRLPVAPDAATLFCFGMTWAELS